MIKIHFTIKEKRGEDKEVVGKISSIGLYFIDQPNIRKGVTRWTSLRDDNLNRCRDKQPVFTTDGIGIITKPKLTRDETGQIIQPIGVNVRIRTLKKEKIFYNLANLNVVDIVDAETGAKYPAVEMDYPFLLLDDMPVEFVVNRNQRAMLSLANRKKLADMKMFTKKSNGIQLLNLLIKKGKWNIK